ncbi:MAG: glycerol-3-phosphate acyltransferase [Bacteroidetes bacterium]|nr:glycerol-3-phosphate acyltransferase [Bacteroidota bacterium]
MLGLTVATISYLVGSFPTAYVIGKHFRNVDLSRNGSGNIGAMNAYEVTGSRIIGISVLAIDVMKGFLMTFLSERYFGLTLALIAALFIVIGHNYSLFMRFRGGRGLAAAAGALLVVQPLAVPVYLFAYFLLRTVGLKLYLSSVIGIISASVLLIARFYPAPVPVALSAGLIAVILSKHLLPLKAEIKNA